VKVSIKCDDEPIIVDFDDDFEMVFIEQYATISLIPQTILLGNEREVKDLIAAITAVAKRNGWDV
jgi:hypothetical protein